MNTEKVKQQNFLEAGTFSMGNAFNGISCLQQMQQKEIIWVMDMFIPVSNNLNYIFLNVLLPGGCRKAEEKQNTTITTEETERVLCSP